MTAPPFGRWRASALPVLLVGALLLALPARSALANDRGKGMLANCVHVVNSAATRVASEEQERAAAAQQLDQALQDLAQAVQHMESLKQPRRQPQGGAFDSGVQQLADYTPGGDTGSPTDATAPGAPTGGSAGASPGTSTAGSGPQQSALTPNGLNKSSTKGSKQSHGAFNKSWHHFRHWWHARHEYRHHDHLFRPGDPGKWKLAAGSGHNTSATGKSTIADRSKSPTNGHKGLPTGGGVAKHQGGNTSTTASTAKTTHVPHPPSHVMKHPAGNSHTVPTTKATHVPHPPSHVMKHPGGNHPTTSTAKPAHFPRHDLVQAARALAGHRYPPVANHYAVAHRLGGSVGNHPVAVHHPAAVHHTAAPAGRRR